MENTNESEVEAESWADESETYDKEKLDKIDKGLKRLKFFTKIKLIITIIIVIGIISYLYAIYAAASSLSIEDESIKSVEPTGDFEEYKAILVLSIKNPTSTKIEIDRITYKAYIDGNYVGEGAKNYFSIDPGMDDYDFEVYFKITYLPPAIKSIFLEDSAELMIKGHVTIPVKVFGLFTYTTITIPYSVTEDVSGGINGNGGPNAPEPVVLHEPVPAGLNSARLTWSISTAADFGRYEVHMSTIMGFEPGIETLVTEIYDISTTTFKISDLQHRTTYYFKIVVWDTENLSSESNEVSYTNI